MSTTTYNEAGHFLLAKTLNDLIQRDEKLTPAVLARNLGIPANKITRILNGDVTDPKASTLLQIASYFDISIEQLLGLEPMVSSIAQEQEGTQQLPVFALSSQYDLKTPLEWYNWVKNDIEGNYHAIITDTDLYEPTFPKNSLLIINTEIEPEDRSFIAVQKTGSSRLYLKKYVADGDKIYFYPINPQLPVEIYEENLYTIVGVILEIHQKVHSRNK